MPLCFNCSGSTVLLSVPSSLGHFTASSGSACGSGTCQVVPWIVECCPGTMEVLLLSWFRACCFLATFLIFLIC